MPSPDTSLATLRPDLAASFEEFDLEADRTGFIGHRVYPVLDVQKQSGKFGRIPIEQLLQARSTDRAPGAGYSRGNWTFTPDSFATEEHGAEEPVDDREADMYAEFFDAELVSARRALDVVLRNAEQRVADACFNATRFTSHTTGVSNEWDDSANATPISDVEAAVQSIYDASGLWANAMIISRKVFRNLRNCAEIQDLVKYQNAMDVRAGNITTSALAQVFDLPYILVAGGTKNIANEGQDASISQIWSGEYALICKIADSNDVREPCIGRTFHWAGDGSMVDGRFESYRDETVRSDIIRYRHDVDEKDLYTEAGHLLSNITT